MDRDQTLLAWPDLLRLLSKYFPDMSLLFRRGEMRVFFFFFLFFFIIIYFCHNLCHSILGKYTCILVLVYEYVNMWEFKFYKKNCGTWVKGLTW